LATQLKRIAKRSKTLIIAAKIYDNWRMKKRFESGNAESIHGSTHGMILKDMSESIDYINVQFADYLTYSGLTLDWLKGSRVFELGFGDNVGVALKFIAAGAEKVVCLDKYYSKRDPEQQRLIYLALRDSLDDDGQKQRFDEAIDLSTETELNPEKIQCIYGSDIENAKELAAIGPFDLVVSRGAIQDIYNPDAAFATMDSILKPGGFMLHKIDLSDQGMFRENGMNALTFLTISESVYGLMAVDSGKPNRKLMNYYRQRMGSLGYDPKLLVTGIIGVGVCGKGDIHPHKETIELGVDYPQATLDLVAEVRSRLIPAFKKLADEELIVDGIFIVARKPEAQAGALN
jgi:SAM-dependent methyltransferase